MGISEKFDFNLIIPVIIVGLFSGFALFLFFSPWKYMVNPINQFSRTFTSLSYEHQSLLKPLHYAKNQIWTGGPLYTWINYWLISITGWVQAGRLISFIFGVGTVILLFKTSDLLYDRKTGYMAGLLLVLSPLFLSNSVLIKRESMMLFFSVLSIFFLAKYEKSGKNKFLLFTGFAVFLSAFSKEAGAFLLIGIGLYLLYKRKLEVFKDPAVYAAFIIPLSLGFLWYFHIQSITPSVQGGAHFGRLITNVSRPIISVVKSVSLELAICVPLSTLGLAFLGIFLWKEKDRLALFWLFSGALFYLSFLQGALHHIHYSTLMLPPLAILGARGGIFLSEKIGSISSKDGNIVLIALSLILVLITSGGLAYLHYTVLEPSQEYQEDLKSAGRYVQEISGEKGVIAMDTRSISIFYHTSLDIRRIETIGDPFAESIVNLNEKPEVIVLRTKHPPYPEWWHAKSPGITENQLDEILSLDSYRTGKKFAYFHIIVRENTI